MSPRGMRRASRWCPCLGLKVRASSLFLIALAGGAGWDLQVGGTATTAAAKPDTPCAVAIPTEEVPAPTAAQADYRARLHAQATGAGVTVAVIDTGIHPHPQLGQLLPGPDLVDPDEPNPFEDCDAHGTVVAGVIAAADIGVAPDARLVSIRQTSAHYREASGPAAAADEAAAGNLDTLAEAIEAAVDEGAEVINISVVSCLPPGAAVDTARLDAVLGQAEAAGTVVVAAAGNAGQNCEPGHTVYPTHSETVISVGALSHPQVHADYSIPPPDSGLALAAPGSVPLGLNSDGRGWARAVMAGDGTGPPRQFTGTSFAAPTVAGTVALLRELHPHASAADIRGLLAQAAEPAHGGLDPLAAVSALPAAYIVDERELAVAAADDSLHPIARRAQMLLLSLAAAGLVAALGWATIRRGRSQ